MGAEVERFEELAKRAQFDPAAVLEALDVPEEMFEQAAKQIYARSQSGRKDPKLREQATQSLREREMQAKLDELEKNYRKLAEERKQEQEQQAIRKQVEEYMGSVTQAVTEEHSIVHSMMQKAPEKARAQLEEAARYLYQQTGETPDPEDVVSTLEKARRAELEELGIEIPKAGKKPKTKPKAKASEKAVAKTLSSDLGTQTQPRDEPPSDEDIDAAILRDLKEGNVEI